MEVMSFRGWVEHIFDATQYSQEFVVANYKSQTHKEAMLLNYREKRSKDYPLVLRFKASTKNDVNAQIADLGVGDRIIVQYVLNGKSGVSNKTGNYYAFNELNITRKEGVVVLEKAKVPDSQVPEKQDADADGELF